MIVLRLKRTRNPDMVCLEKMQHFLQDMQKRDVPVLLCGVRKDFADALGRLGFHDWLPADRIFLEEAAGNGDVRDARAVFRRGRARARAVLDAQGDQARLRGAGRRPVPDLPAAARTWRRRRAGTT